MELLLRAFERNTCSRRKYNLWSIGYAFVGAIGLDGIGTPAGKRSRSINPVLGIRDIEE